MAWAASHVRGHEGQLPQGGGPESQLLAAPRWTRAREGVLDYVPALLLFHPGHLA